MKWKHLAFLAAAVGAALFIFGGLSRAADGNFPIYFRNSKLIVKAETLNRATYLPLREIVEFMGLPYTDALVLDTLTIRSGNSRLVATNNSGLISFNDQIVLLPAPVIRKDGNWIGPVEFLTQGLSRLSGTAFRFRPGTSRIFAADVEAPELVMNAQSLGPITRLTLRGASPLSLDLRRDEQAGRAVLTIDPVPIDPIRERLDYKDRLVRSISFDDSDGNAKIVLDLTSDAADIKVASTDENRVFFVDVLRKGESTTTAPPPPVETPGTAKPDGTPTERRVRVIVIDPGHGGMDSGISSATTSEKDFTLMLARRLRTALQVRLGATTLLTRDSDVVLDSEARSAVANNNQANLFISLHAGYSSNKLDSSSSVFIMKENLGEAFGPASAARDQLFLPWYFGYKPSRAASAQAAKILQEELSKTIPGLQFVVRTAPLAVLSSTTMPSLLFEIGNLNNPVNAQTLIDTAFQNRLTEAIVGAVQRFSESQRPARAN